MMRFRLPKLRKMHNGECCIELTEEGTWESFGAFAEAFTKQIGARVIRRIDGPDVRLWEIHYLGHDLRLVYDDFPNGVSLEPISNGQDSVIAELFKKFSSEASEDGI